MITVEELIEMLSELPSDAIVIQPKDAKGKKFSTIVDVTEGFFDPDKETFHGEDEDIEDAKSCVVLWTS